MNVDFLVMTSHVCPLVVVEMNFAATIPGSYERKKVKNFKNVS